MKLYKRPAQDKRSTNIAVLFLSAENAVVGLNLFDILESIQKPPILGLEQLLSCFILESNSGYRSECNKVEVLPATRNKNRFTELFNLHS